MMRRDFLTATPVAVLAGAAGAAAHVDETPVGRLFKEWQRLHDYSNERGISEEECLRRAEAEMDIEEVLRNTPPRTAQDVARKALIEVGFGVFDAKREFWVEMCGLAGVPVSSLMIPCFEDEVGSYTPSVGGAA